MNLIQFLRGAKYQVNLIGEEGFASGASPHNPTLQLPSYVPMTETSVFSLESERDQPVRHCQSMEGVQRLETHKIELGISAQV